MPDTDSDIQDFAERVKAMRVLQRAFEKGGRYSIHEAARRAESEVDQVCERILSTQGDLFAI